MVIERMSVSEIQQSIVEKLEGQFGCEISDATQGQLYQAVASTVREEVMRRRTASRGERKRQRAKKLYYLSAEFLVGRAMHNNMVSLVNEENYMKALEGLGIDKRLLFEQEPEPGLGNGGLGRLAACFLDSLTTLELPAMGCTIRYEYGLFKQKIVDGYQVELPDNWLENGNLWEIVRPDQAVEVRFGGYVEEVQKDGRMCFEQKNYSTILAVPYDMPVLGYDTNMVNMLRTWSAKSPKEIDMQSFNRGDYVRAMEERELCEVISKVLYPEDNHYEGKELRLKQQYFLSSASVQYIVRDFEKTYGPDWDIFPDKVAIHVNDTHPGMAIPELMRILLDEKGLSWERAEDIVYRTHGAHADAAHIHDFAGDEQAPVRPPVERVSRPVGTHWPHGRAGLWSGAYGEFVRGVFAHGERRFPDSRGYPAQKDLLRLLHDAAGQIPGHHQRHHAPALADAGQSRPGAFVG